MLTPPAIADREVVVPVTGRPGGLPQARERVRGELGLVVRVSRLDNLLAQILLVERLVVLQPLRDRNLQRELGRQGPCRPRPGKVMDGCFGAAYLPIATVT